MAKKESKEQLKKERRRAMERKRRETGWEPPPQADVEQQQLLADMAPLFMGAEEEMATEGVAMVPFMERVLGSDELVEEPEFDGVYVHPLLCAQAFAEAMDELDLEDVEPGDVPTEEEEEIRAELMEMTTMMVLTADLQETILAALGDLRERAREEGDQDLMAQAAAVYAFLEGVALDEVWPTVGVVQAVIHRSLRAGVELYEIVEEEGKRAAKGGGGPGLLRRIVGGTLEQRMQRVLDKYPGLAEFMAEQVEDDWEEGASALRSGELDLGLFTEEEISAAFAEARALGLELTREGDLVRGESAGDDVGYAFARRLERYVGELASPERLAQMQARVDELAMAADPSWVTFLSTVSDAFEKKDRPELLHGLLVHALVGEMQNSVWEEKEQG